jgi:hypothetical protein
MKGIKLKNSSESAIFGARRDERKRRRRNSKLEKSANVLKITASLS